MFNKEGREKGSEFIISIFGAVSVWCINVVVEKVEMGKAVTVKIESRW